MNEKRTQTETVELEISSGDGGATAVVTLSPAHASALVSVSGNDSDGFTQSVVFKIPNEVAAGEWAMLFERILSEIRKHNAKLTR